PSCHQANDAARSACHPRVLDSHAPDATLGAGHGHGEIPAEVHEAAAVGQGLCDETCRRVHRAFPADAAEGDLHAALEADAPLSPGDALPPDVATRGRNGLGGGHTTAAVEDP